MEVSKEEGCINRHTSIAGDPSLYKRTNKQIGEIAEHAIRIKITICNQPQESNP